MRPRELPYVLRSFVIAPNGETMLWTEGKSEKQSRRLLLGRWAFRLWAFSLTQGYRTKWQRVLTEGTRGASR